MHTHTYIHAYIHTYIHTSYIHAYIHTYIHPCTGIRLAAKNNEEKICVIYDRRLFGPRKLDVKLYKFSYGLVGKRVQHTITYIYIHSHKYVYTYRSAARLLCRTFGNNLYHRCMYVCMCMCMYVCVRVSVFMCVYVYVCVHVYVYMYICVCMCMYYVCMYVGEFYVWHHVWYC